MGVVKCANCGARVNDQAVGCPECGANLQTGDIPQAIRLQGTLAQVQREGAQLAALDPFDVATADVPEAAQQLAAFVLRVDAVLALAAEAVEAEKLVATRPRFGGLAEAVLSDDDQVLRRSSVLRDALRHAVTLASLDYCRLWWSLESGDGSLDDGEWRRLTQAVIDLGPLLDPAMVEATVLRRARKREESHA
jgi:hypothetical protein